VPVTYWYACLFLGRVALVRGGASYIVIKLSSERSVGRSVCLSTALWKNGRSDPDAVWRHRSDGSRDEAGSCVWDQSTGRGTFGAKLGRAIVTNGDFMAYVCDSASTVEAAVWDGACGGPRHWGPHRARGRGFWGFVPHFHNGKCH